MQKVLVFGSLNMDMMIYTDRMPAQGETITGSDFKLSPGGKGANQAVAAARLGAHAAMLGCVGDDAFGRNLLAALRTSGVDTDAIHVTKTVGTGNAVIVVSEHDNRIILYTGANHAMDVGFVEANRTLIERSDSLLVQLEVPLPAVRRAMEIARQAGRLVYLNPAPAQRLPQELYALADFIVPNETEAAILLGQTISTEEEFAAALFAFRAWGVRQPLITMGKRGVAYLDRDTPRIMPCFPAEAVDTTAAGDTFIGGLAAAIGRSETLADAIRFAQRASSLCVSRKGAQEAIPTLAEVTASIV